MKQLMMELEMHVINIKTTENSAFAECKNNNQNWYPFTVTSIGEYSFKGCTFISDCTLLTKLTINSHKIRQIICFNRLIFFIAMNYLKRFTIINKKN